MKYFVCICILQWFIIKQGLTIHLGVPRGNTPHNTTRLLVQLVNPASSDHIPTSRRGSSQVVVVSGGRQRLPTTGRHFEDNARSNPKSFADLGLEFATHRHTDRDLILKPVHEGHTHISPSPHAHARHGANVHVDLPGEHGNLSPFPVVHRASSHNVANDHRTHAHVFDTSQHDSVSTVRHGLRRVQQEQGFIKHSFIPGQGNIGQSARTGLSAISSSSFHHGGVDVHTGSIPSISRPHSGQSGPSSVHQMYRSNMLPGAASPWSSMDRLTGIHSSGGQMQTQAPFTMTGRHAQTMPFGLPPYVGPIHPPTSATGTGFTRTGLSSPIPGMGVPQPSVSPQHMHPDTGSPHGQLSAMTLPRPIATPESMTMPMPGFRPSSMGPFDRPMSFLQDIPPHIRRAMITRRLMRMRMRMGRLERRLQMLDSLGL